MRRNFPLVCMTLLAAAASLLAAQGLPPLEKDLLATGPLFAEPRSAATASAAVKPDGSGAAPAKNAGGNPGGGTSGGGTPGGSGGTSASGGATQPAAPATIGVASLRVRGTGADQRFYTLLAGRDAAVIVFSADGTRLAQIPAVPYRAASPDSPSRNSAAAAAQPLAPPLSATTPRATQAGAGTATPPQPTASTPPVAPATPAASGASTSASASRPNSAPAQPAPTPGPSRGLGTPAQPAPAMPPADAKDAKLIFASDFDVDADGRVIIADRGADAVKIYDSTGALLSVIAVQSPVSVAALPGGEIAVTNLRSDKLVTVYALRASPIGGASAWRVSREFGDPVEVTDVATAKELNRYVNIGRLSRDAEGNIYYTFYYLPEPTIRKYDRWGFLINEVALTTPEFQPTAQSMRRAIDRLSQGRYSIGATAAPILRAIVTAIGVDPVSQDLWVAMGTLLLHFDRDGARRGTYRTFTADLQRVEASAILVESARLVISSDSIGAFAFPRPDKQPPAPRPALK